VADGTKDTPKKQDPVAPGSSKNRERMKAFFNGALQGLTVNYAQGGYIDSPVGNGLVTRQNVNKDVSKYTPGKSYGSSLLSRFSPSSTFKEVTVRRLGTTQIHSGDSDVDRAVSDALNDVSDVVNVFQDNVRKAFKATDKRLSNLETDVKRVDKRLRTVENDNRNITKKLRELAKPVVSGRTIDPKEIKTTLPAPSGGSANTADSKSSLIGSALTTAVEGIIGAKALKALKFLGSAAVIGSVGAATYGMRRTSDDKRSMYDSDVKEYGQTKANILKDRRNFGVTGWLNNRMDDVYQKFAGKKKDEKKGSPDQKANEFPSEDLEFKTKGMMTLESDKDAVITSKTKITLKAPEIVIDGRLNIKQHITSSSVVTEPRSSADKTHAEEVEGRTIEPNASQARGVSSPGTVAPVTPIRPDLTTNSITTQGGSVSQQAPENFTLTKGYHPRGTPSFEAPSSVSQGTQSPMGKTMGPVNVGPIPSGSALKGDALRRGVYQAFRNAGYSHQGALVLSGEVARENSFNPNLVFGNHVDPANGARNSGMFSWQGSRNKELMKFLADRGALDKNGNIIRDQNALNAQAEFIKKELSKKEYGGGKFNDMLSQKNVDRNAMADLLGKRYIKWRIDDPRYRDAGIRNRTRGYDQTARAVEAVQSKQVASLDPTSGVSPPQSVLKSAKPKDVYNSLTAKANYMQPSQYGAPGTNIVSVKTAGGHKFRINAASKEAFQRTIEDLERAGMPLGQIGGYNPRPGGIGGRGKMSQHAMGNAMDIGSQTGRDIINKSSREWIEKNPKLWREILDRNGMISGGDWRNPDLGHLEWSGRKPWLENPELYAARQEATDASTGKKDPSDAKLKMTRLAPPIQEMDDAPQRGVDTPNYSKNVEDRTQSDTSLKNPWWKFWAKENVTPKTDYDWANKINKFDAFKMEKARKAIGLGGSDEDLAKAVDSSKGQMTTSDRLAQLNIIKREDGKWTPDQAKEASDLAKQMYAPKENSLKDLAGTFQKAQDLQDARVVESIPKPQMDLADRSGEEMTANIKDTVQKEATQKSESSQQSVHHHGSDEPSTSIRAPRHDAESQGPTPGSDGYGSGKQDPDGFCALCMA
jgi:hypothetical protein